MTKHLLSGHAHFHTEYFAGEREFLQRLASEGQNPSALYVGCSDSRVIPELLTSSRPGELFVVRNVANIVPSYQHPNASVGAALDYAVEVLRVPHLIVCGHDGCGGVKAALDGLDKLAALPTLQGWLGEAAPAAWSMRQTGLTGDELLRAAVEENVLNQMDNLITYPVVERALREQRLTLHGWVFAIADGGLRVYDAAQQEFVAASAVVSATGA